MKMKGMLLLAALACGVVLPAMAEEPKSKNGMLVDEDNMTLYTFDKDMGGKSVCEGPCASKWPPALADSYDKASGDWSLIKRMDGKMQWAYKGKPLYRWAMDKKAGDATGDGMGGMWHTAKP